jgi:hypothetical protein
MATVMRPLRVLLATAALSSPTVVLGVDDTPQVDYMLRCQGCHVGDGSGYPGKVPDLRVSLRALSGTPGGREFLLRVPGASLSILDNEQLARVYNWMFAEFDPTPLGSASIAQVHKAKLLDGRTVAIKVQRPGIQPKLIGDIQNLKAFSKLIAKSLPLDYYMIFCEIERTLIYELDFLYEAQFTQKVFQPIPSRSVKN